MFRFDGKIDIKAMLALAAVLVVLVRVALTAESTAATVAKIQVANTAEHKEISKRITALEAASYRQQGYNAAIATMNEGTNEN